MGAATCAVSEIRAAVGSWMRAASDASHPRSAMMNSWYSYEYRWTSRISSDTAVSIWLYRRVCSSCRYSHQLMRPATSAPSEAAEEETNGAMLNARGREKGIDPLTFHSGTLGARQLHTADNPRNHAGADEYWDF